MALFRVQIDHLPNPFSLSLSVSVSQMYGRFNGSDTFLCAVCMASRFSVYVLHVESCALLKYVLYTSCLYVEFCLQILLTYKLYTFHFLLL